MGNAVHKFIREPMSDTDEKRFPHIPEVEQSTLRFCVETIFTCRINWRNICICLKGVCSLQNITAHTDHEVIVSKMYIEEGIMIFLVFDID